MSSLKQVQTPALLLDRACLEANAARMRQRAEQLGVKLRPHMKTAKCDEIARVAHGGVQGPITVATINEAEFFFAQGYQDMLYAVCVVPQKLDRIAAITTQGGRLSVIVDSITAARAVAAHQGPHTVLIEIDCGENRTGIRPDDPALLDIAKALTASPSCTLLGVLTHGGHSYSAQDIPGIVQVAEAERMAAVQAAQILREAELSCEVVSVGSTPTAMHAAHLEGVTEMRPGVYLLGDLFQAGVKSCGSDQIAATVLASVISHRRDSNRLVVDAGGLALSKDRSTAGRPFDSGYGWVLDAKTGLRIGDLQVRSVHQEHGEVTSERPLPWDRLPIGALVRIQPNHICMTAAMYDRYHVIGSDGQVEATWPRTNGW